MIIKSKRYTMSISDKDGSLESFNNGSKELLCCENGKKPLFTLRFRDTKGHPIFFNAHDARQFSIETGLGRENLDVKLIYRFLKDESIHVTVYAACPFESQFTYWNLEVEHDTDYYLEWIDFPNITVPNDLIAKGGDGRVLWPALEGVLVEDVDLRTNDPGFRYSPMEYPSRGWEGCYPGACPTQFMAYYGSGGGLYLGAHDNENNIKAVEYYKYGEGIRLEFKLFPGAEYRGSYKMDYNMVLGVFYGDWHDAADIYRNWFESTRSNDWIKLYENKKLPEWMAESPVVVIYPVRGTKDTGDMTPNEYFPYTNALPHLEKLAEGFKSKVMALLMHWEGTAPWAPPYVWPPFGGEEIFREFVDKMHEKGNLTGVYCSGIAWTNESILVPEYNRRQQFEEQHLIDIMCMPPEGEKPNSHICNGCQRWSYDMCPTSKFVEDVMLEEVSSIIGSGCDYIQYFDQNLGGISYFCYSKNHGHPHSPGKWQKDAMIKLYKRLQELIDASGKKIPIGCESAASEPFIPYLLFNDLRFNGGFNIGNPVPVYSYIYHEYVNNFMGNQGGTMGVINHYESPDNILYRTAYSFNAGDMPTVVLRGNGEINWDWGTEWDIPGPDQEAVAKLIRNLNNWRKNAAKPFLLYGRMEKPYEIKCTYDKEICKNYGGKLTVPPLLTSRWISPEGRNAQIIINYTKDEQEFSIISKELIGRKIKVYGDATTESNDIIVVSEESVRYKVGQLNALMMEIT